MSESTRTIEELTSSDYEFGFSTDLDTDIAPPGLTEDTVRLMTEISKEQGLTLVMSIHNRDFARRYFPRLVGMRSGRVAFDSPAEEVDDASFQKLYDLGNGEMMRDGA